MDYFRIMKFLKRLLLKKHRFSGEILPEQAFVAVGDIHGRADLLDRLLADLESGPHAELPIVFVGDYVDRGEQSADVLRLLTERAEAGNTVCLLGNHEQMLLNFLEDPANQGPRWLRYGGLQTMASYGLPLVAQTAPEEAWVDAREALFDAMGHDLIQWLHDLPALWQSGNVAVLHAGADPEQPMDQQERRTLVWGHPEFDTEDRRDGVWVVHGHTIVDNAVAERGRISIDTGAYATGTLSAAVVAPGEVSFLTT